MKKDLFCCFGQCRYTEEDDMCIEYVCACQFERKVTVNAENVVIECDSFEMDTDLVEES